MPVMAAAVPPRAYEPPPFASTPVEPPAPPPTPEPSPDLPGTGAAAALPLVTRATFLDRLVAGALDLLFVLFVFNMFLDRYFWNDSSVIFFLCFAYFVTFWSWKGTTLGGMICNLRVVRANGTALAGADAVVRGLASVFSFVPLGLGFFWILRDPQQQAWHDKISGTVVIKDLSGS